MKTGKRQNGTKYKTVKQGEVRGDGKIAKSNDRMSYLNAQRAIYKMLALDKTKDEMMQYLMEERDYSEDRATRIISDCKRNVREKYEKFADDVAKHNIEKLQYILDESIEDDDKKTALSTVAELNKMTGQYINKVEVKSEEPIKLSFDK